MARRIGIYSGTFDPVHAGHIAFAVAALAECNLSEVVFIPEERPRGKQNVTDISHRVALLEKAIDRAVELRTLVLPSHQFTIQETLPALRQEFRDAELTLLVGSDVARSLPQWPQISMLFEEMSLAIGMRMGDSRQEIENVLQATTQSRGTFFVETAFSHYTSSRARSGDFTQLTPQVADYVTRRSLYPQTM